jgi:hypothetical protein
MKRVRPAKQVLIKRTRPKLDEYDYIFVDKNKVDHLLESKIRNPDLGTIFEMAGLYARIEYKIKHIKKSKLFNQILLLIIGGLITLLVQFIIENWIKK